MKIARLGGFFPDTVKSREIELLLRLVAAAVHAGTRYLISSQGYGGLASRFIYELPPFHSKFTSPKRIRCRRLLGRPERTLELDVQIAGEAPPPQLFTSPAPRSSEQRQTLSQRKELAPSDQTKMDRMSCISSYDPFYSPSTYYNHRTSHTNLTFDRREAVHQGIPDVRRRAPG